MSDGATTEIGDRFVTPGKGKSPTTNSGKHISVTNMAAAGDEIEKMATNGGEPEAKAGSLSRSAALNLGLTETYGGKPIVGLLGGKASIRHGSTATDDEKSMLEPHGKSGRPDVT